MPAEEVLWFSAEFTEGIPNEPGLYAWYAVPVAGPPDYGVEHDEHGQDRGGYNFGSFLASHTLRLRSPDLDVSLAGPFWAEWAGSVTEHGYQVLASNMEKLAEGRSGRGAKLNWALHNSDARERLAAVLEAASPRLSSPIYIGVSVDLADRIRTHLDAHRRAQDSLDVGDDIPDDVAGTFGARAALAEIALDELRVAVLPVPIAAGIALADARKVAEAAEFVLNRWHKPIFGER